jgi:hypothetical protein
MQRDPDGSVAVFGKLDEVVAAAERAERELPVLVVLIRRRARVLRELLEGPDAGDGRACELDVVASGAHRDAPFDARAYRGGV